MKCIFLLTAFLLVGCSQQLSSSSGVTKEGGSFSKFWTGQETNPKIDIIVYSDYEHRPNSQLFGSSIWGSGYHDMGGIVTSFAKTGPQEFLILDHFFDLRNGRFFHVRRKDQKHLEVIQKDISDPVAQEIITIR